MSEKRTINLNPYEIRCKIRANEFILEIDGTRGNNYNCHYTIILHGWSTFGHYLAQESYKAIKAELKEVIAWKDNFKERLKD